MELSPPNSDQFTFNTYDIFTNFLPGAILLIGLWAPFASISNPLPTFSLVQAAILVIIAFAAGIGTLGIGSSLSSNRSVFEGSDTPFNEKVEEISKADELSNIEAGFQSFCQKDLNIVDNFDDLSDDECNSLFKTLISYLEARSVNRALRIQALYLACRGLSISFIVLAGYYLSTAIYLISTQQLSGTTTLSELYPFLILVFYGLLSIVIAWLFVRRTNHFEDDVTEYVVSECHLLHLHEEQKSGSRSPYSKYN